MDDKTDVSTDASSDSGDSGTSSLSDLASSALGSLFGSAASAAGKALNNVVAGTPSNPSADIAAKAATPGGTSRISVGAISLPVILIGGAALAFILMRR